MSGNAVTHFRLVEKLGVGLGAVHKAEDTKLRSRVARKILPEEMATDEQALERFQR